MAEKVVALISTIYPQMMKSGITERILELEKKYGKLDTTIVFKIAEEVAKQKFCEFPSLVDAMGRISGMTGKWHHRMIFLKENGLTGRSISCQPIRSRIQAGVLT